MSDSPTYTFGDKTYTLLAEHDAGQEYSWNITALLRAEDGALWIAQDGGCSCNYFGMDDPFTLEPVASWQEAAESAKAWLTATDHAGFAAKLLTLDPK